MIKGIYETHINVENLETSIEFYQNVLGLKSVAIMMNEELHFFGLANHTNIC